MKFVGLLRRLATTSLGGERRMCAERSEAHRIAHKSDALRYAQHILQRQGGLNEQYPAHRPGHRRRPRPGPEHRPGLGAARRGRGSHLSQQAGGERGSRRRNSQAGASSGDVAAGCRQVRRLCRIRRQAEGDSSAALAARPVRLPGQQRRHRHPRALREDHRGPVRRAGQHPLEGHLLPDPEAAAPDRGWRPHRQPVVRLPRASHCRATPPMRR